MKVKSVKKSTVKKKALKAPSPVSATKKKLAPYKGKKKKDWNEAIQQMQKEASGTEKKLANRMLDKKKGKETNKAVKKIANRSKKITPEMHQIIHANYMEYLKHVNRPRWGNGELDPDSKGFDGYDSLHLVDYVAKELALKPKRLQEVWNDKPGPKLTEALVKASIYNVWQWSNFCSRIHMETLALDPPIRRIVNIDLKDIFPFAEDAGSINRYMNIYFRDNTDATQAFANLGNMRYKVRLLLTIHPRQELAPKTIYRLFDMMKFPVSNNSIWGLALNLSKELSYFTYPREAVILQPNNLRKSREAESYLDEAIEAGYRVILPYELVKGNATSVKEIKQSSIYRKLSESWKGLSPLITMPTASKMVKVAKVSKLSDILLV